MCKWLINVGNKCRNCTHRVKVASFTPLIIKIGSSSTWTVDIKFRLPLKSVASTMNYTFINNFLSQNVYYSRVQRQKRPYIL